jgi:pimeloyl-ACP methyl ester carboxylesterase
MTHNHPVTRIDLQDPTRVAAVQAERGMFAQYDLDYRAHTIKIDEYGLCLRVLECGQGEPLVMVPGGAGDAVFFAPLIAQLSGYRVIAINRPGGGMSDGIDHRQLDLRDLAIRTIETVVAAFELDSVAMLANSMGGLWAFWYALAHPERVSRMVQIGCPALLLGTSAPFFMRLLAVPGLNALIARAMQPSDLASAADGLKSQGSYPEDIARIPPAGSEAVYRFFNLPTYRDSWKTLVSAVLTPLGPRPKYVLDEALLRQVDLPVQFIWGDNDPFGSLDVARQAAEMLPEAQLHQLRAGHLPHIDQPEAVAPLVQQFLDQS